MLKITQFEVHKLEQGRWTFHARYPGYEWDQALDDARRTEIRVGNPTKIIKESYNRESGRSEEALAYMSPNAKKSASQRPNQSLSDGNSTNQTVSPVSDTTFFFRLILSLGASVIIAGALTILLNAVLNALPKLGFQITSAFGSQLLMYWYIAMLMLCAIALNKAYVPWRRMLAGRQSHQAALDAQQPSAKKMKPAPGFTGLKPKNQTSEQVAEQKRATQDMKVLRGDPDSLQPLDTPGAPETPVSDPISTPTPPPLPVANTGNVDQKDTFGTGESSDGHNQDRKESLEHVHSASDEQSTAAEPEVGPKPQTPLTDMDIDGLIMVRFIGDVVMSVRSGQDQLDGTTRFGMSLYLAGAASKLADQRGLTPRQEKEIFSDALELVGHSSAIRDSFLARYDEHLNAKRNQSLIEAGEQDMLEHLRSPDGPAQDLGGLLETWDQTDLALQPAIGGAFLLTYTEVPQSSLPGAEDAAMDRHNREVRKVISDCSGSEVRHTGKGIFAHFDYADDAICASIAIQKAYENRRKSSDPLPPTRVSMVASATPGSDSDISGEVFHAADTLCRRMSNRQIACDLQLRKACTIEDVSFGREIPSAHSGIGDELKASEIIWQTLAETP